MLVGSMVARMHVDLWHSRPHQNFVETSEHVLNAVALSRNMSTMRLALQPGKQGNCAQGHEGFDHV